jgi:homoserine dehydrogenase
MHDEGKIIVLKFGSSILRDENDLPRAVHEIYRWWRHGSQVLAVVSAFGNTTDQLLRRAKTLCDQPEQVTLATLLATGEAVSAALLGLALNRAGIPATVLDPAQAGLRTTGDALNADLVALDGERLRRELRDAIVVLPGFIGREENGNTTLLGRGGSDLSALFLAHRLGAQCVLLKDVDGIYASDPATATTRPVRFAEIKYETTSHLAGKLVQPKAIRFAAAHHLPFSVTSIGSAHQTSVGPTVDRFAVTQIESPLRVALLGCGTVGSGVYQALSSLPDPFAVSGVGTRNANRALAAGVPEPLITNDLDELIESECDVVVELIGDTKPAGRLITQALLAGRHVITANKALIAQEGDRLASLADDCSVTLRYSAAVGGAMPALEAIERSRRSEPLRSFRGVLNGTTNFVLGLMERGHDLNSAIRKAREEGYAEANCRLDLDGTDAAQKVMLLARRAFDVTLRFETIERTGIESVDEQWIRRARAKGKVLRLVASCSSERDRLRASVKPIELPQSDPLAATAGVENRLEIQTESGRSFFVRGKGAGRWPTTEAIMADLLDISRETRLIAEQESLEAEEVCA